MTRYLRLILILLTLALLFTMASSANTPPLDSSSIPMVDLPVSSTTTPSNSEASSTPSVVSQPSSASFASGDSVAAGSSSTPVSTPTSSSTDSSLVTSSSVSYSETGSSISANSMQTEPDEATPSSTEVSSAVSSEIHSEPLPQSNTNAPVIVSPPPTPFATTSYYNSSSPLGIAGSFHLVGFNSVSMNAHTNGNVLTNTLYANANFGTNNLADELSYIQNYSRVNSGSATASNHTLVVGSSNVVTLVDNGNAIAINGTKLDRPKIVWQDASTQFIDLSYVRAATQAFSSTLQGYSTTNISANLNPVGGSVSESYISLIDSENGGVFNTTATELSSIRYLGVNGFKSTNNAAVVINVDCEQTANISLPVSLISVDNNILGCAETHVFVNGRVIWNFYNLLPSSGTTITASLLHGSVLAESARFIASQNLNGTVIANDIEIRAESHRDDFVGVVPTPIEPTLSLVVTKEWKNPAGSPLKSSNYSAIISLYQDGVAYGTPITLNETNSFTHTFADLPTGHNYSVQEQKILLNNVDVTDRFSVYIQQDMQNILISNTLNSSAPVILPATGGFAPILTITGIIIIILSLLFIYYFRRTV